MTQALLTIFLPTLMVLVGILINRGDAARIDGRISSLENRLDGRISGLESRLEGKITALESRLHGDMLQVIGKLTELEVCVARLEQEK
jgi:hypothetical protein